MHINFEKLWIDIWRVYSIYRYDNQSEEFDDFKLCSEEIEQELSASVADLEKANKNLQHRLTAKTLEFEALEV